jgi:hypothetical protein
MSSPPWTGFQKTLQRAKLFRWSFESVKFFEEKETKYPSGEFTVRQCSFVAWVLQRIEEKEQRGTKFCYY